MNVLMLGQSTKIAKVLSCFCDEITIVVETSLKTSRLSKELKDYHVIMCPTDIFSLGGILCRVRELKKWVKDTNSKIIFSNTRNDMIAAKIYSLIYNRNVILIATSHNSLAWNNKIRVRLMSCLIRLTTDCFVSLASFVHNQLINFGVKEKNLIFLPNIIEYEQWKVKTNYSILSPFRMVYVAYVLPNKCQDFIVDVLFMLANRYNVVVDCYGDLTNSEYVDSIQEKVKRYSLEGNLNLLGCIDNSLLKNILKSYDAYICPSKMEMSPVNILEAQASGLPVIASNVGGISDLIRDHEDGLLFEWNDVEDAADKIIKLIKDEELRLKLGETARKRVSESYTAQIAGRKLFDKIKNYC